VFNHGLDDMTKPEAFVSAASSLGHAAKLAPPLPAGFLRLPQVLALIPISRRTWFRGVKDGRYPQPVKLGARATGWRVEDIRNVVETRT
jgi:prophage regulatory protein